MNTIIKFKKPELPLDWSYEESVKQIKGIIYKWGNMTEGLLRELWIARNMLSREGRPWPQKIIETKVPVKTWSGYCLEIGSSRQVINRWLSAFEAGWQNVLLSQNSEEKIFYNTQRPHKE